MGKKAKATNTTAHREQPSNARHESKLPQEVKSSSARKGKTTKLAKKSEKASAEAGEPRAESAADLLEEAVGKKVVEECSNIAEQLVKQAKEGKPTSARLVVALCDRIRGNMGSQNAMKNWGKIMLDLQEASRKAAQKTIASESAPAPAQTSSGEDAA